MKTFLLVFIAVAILAKLSSIETAKVLINSRDVSHEYDQELKFRRHDSKILKNLPRNRRQKLVFVISNKPTDSKTLNDLIIILNAHIFKTKEKERLNNKQKCNKVFGSMYGLKYCLKETGKKKGLRGFNIDILKYWPLKYLLGANHSARAHKDPIDDSNEDFVDVTRTRDDTGDFDVTNSFPISNDYIDFTNLRRDAKALKGRRNRPKWEQSSEQTTSESESREVPKREQSSKQTSSEIESSLETVRKSKKKSRKPKRDEVTSSEPEAEAIAKPKRDLSSSDDEDVEPIFEQIRKEKPREGYVLQGNRLVYLDADKRRRLPYFLPKRIFWKHDDLPNLGYFWFNGPKGSIDY